jgi:hypothetical protein
MDDSEIVRHIGDLTDEEHRLEAGAHEGLSDDERARLHAIERSLDQCWDLLRQRRARRAAHLDPDDVALRPESVVEGYQQ